MFVQVITLQAPIGQISRLRQLVSDEYLPALQNRPGFVAAHLLEQIDEPDAANLMIYWTDQHAVENTQRTGVLAGSTQSIAARIPGLRIRRQSYIVRVTVDNRQNAPA